MGVRLPAIDGLRAFAVLAVIAFHYRTAYFPGGWVGVDLFFVISGFVITAGLLREQQGRGAISIRRFYARRVRRIIPPLAVLIVVVAAVGLLVRQPTPPLDLAAAALSFMNWRRAFGWSYGGPLAHTWSLSVEEQFYALWPLILILLGRRRVPRLAPALLVVVVIVTLVWRAHLRLDGAILMRTYNGLDTRADGLALGCLLAIVGPEAVPRAVLRLWLAPAAVLVAVIFTVKLGNPLMPLGGYTVTAICSAWLVAVAAQPASAAHRLLTSRPVQWTGLRSYSLYLWHFPATQWLDGRYFPMKTPLLVAATFIAAALSYRFIERPFAARRADMPAAPGEGGEAA